MFESFKKNIGLSVKQTPITESEAKQLSEGMPHMAIWLCKCGAKLRIRSKIERSNEASNFYPDRGGHSRLPADLLNWNGLAEERGWITHPTAVCPACRKGLSVRDYKAMKRLA